MEVATLRVAMYSIDTIDKLKCLTYRYGWPRATYEVWWSPGP